jgi:transcriptional regulator with XRE-family HTH domain
MVGEYVKALRDAAGFNQRELADRVGISPSMLSLIESGRREPSIQTLRDIGHALDVPTAALFAVALAEAPASEVAPAIDANLKQMTETLLSAVQRMLVVRRLHAAHGQS